MLTLLLLVAAALAAPVHVLTLRGGVDPGSADYLISGIAAAEDAGAAAVIIELDTPGGLLQSAREIVSAELGSGVPVVVWVGPSGARAGSAGVFLTLASHVAVMAPGTTIGAAHPVSMFGDEQPAPAAPAPASPAPPSPIPEVDPAQPPADPAPAEAPAGTVMDAKILNDTLAWARAIATERGRDAEWAEASVRDSATLTDREALARGVVDLSAADLDALLTALDGRTVTLPDGPVVLATAGAEIVRVPMSFRQRLVHFLGDPNVLMALIGLGLLALYIEYQSPGLIVPGALGVLLLLGAGVGLSVLPFQLGGLLLIVAGFITIGLEAYIGGKGIFAVLGTGGVVLGGLLLFEVEGFDLRVDPMALSGLGLFMLIVAAGLGTLLARAQKRPVQTGAEGMLGKPGLVTVAGDGHGRARVQGEDWAARWTGRLEAGALVRVRRVDGNTLDVEPDGSGGT